MTSPHEHVRIALMFVRFNMPEFALRRIMNAIRAANHTKASPAIKASLFRMMNWLRADIGRAKQ